MKKIQKIILLIAAPALMFQASLVVAKPNFISCPANELVKQSGQNLDLVKPNPEEEESYTVSTSSPMLFDGNKSWYVSTTPIFAHNIRDALIKGQGNVLYARVQLNQYAYFINEYHTCFYLGKNPKELVMALSRS